MGGVTYSVALNPPSEPTPLVPPRVPAPAESGVDVRTWVGIAMPAGSFSEAILSIGPGVHSWSLCCPRGGSVQSPEVTGCRAARSEVQVNLESVTEGKAATVFR